MSRPIDVLAQELLGLPTSERARLLDRLIASLDQDATRAAAWDRLAAERELELQDDSSLAIPADEVLAGLRAGLS